MKNILSSLLLFVSVSLFAQVQRPKLVVGIVVDQMKMDYLYRFQNDFSENGFKRLMNEGYTFHNTHYNYFPTSTAPGHSSIYTGTTPAVHGIMGNDWFNRKVQKSIYCTDDDSVSILGVGSEKEGKMSPKNLMATTVTDELRLSTNFQGKVIGVSLKDRGSILPAGHFANWAFWYSDSGNFISSTFYGDALPSWVTEFNDQKHYMKYVNQGWNLLKPAAAYNESLPDDNPHELDLFKHKPVFPYDLKTIFAESGAKIFRTIPQGNDLLEEFAKRAIEKEQLGKDEITDFLTVSFSSTDYAGHDFGTRSMEVQDTYLRLDLTIADFLNYLDKTVGKGNYLVFLTADHAAAETPKFLKEHKYNIDNVETKSIRAAIREFSKNTYGENLLLDYTKNNVFINREILKTKGLDLNTVKQGFKDFLMTQEQVKRVYTEEEILANSGADYFLNAIAKGYDVSQNGDLVVLDKLGYIEGKAKGTEHSAPYTYDTHVPLVFFGWKIKHGETHDKKVITQIAPTVAQKLKITLPNGTESNVLLEVLE
ncbi:alkaline phosphatase PafA [Flavobacterium capsici]|uniref:Alkaline phosphatase PafA n=1 Tax=Flavobacterium capsici TaxID=3075618 RepID=A0AA96F077_9FLAO|nr:MULTISPECIES: alkaline phosphatase PafA [unclassified Flavobacterium]WNM20185.1 alkaline phosphatase PafA [Flavobacterium sp. PMR2A8]WNM21575.1 alkaline phosphatase PafA [Flavobacterium sp. PMTSA4]